MMIHPSPPTDADLLSRYLQAGDEGAFASLVRAHESLVIGTAARITGNVELARDVAQQVFATLARKAWLLTGRTSLAGWLHHASRHLALRAVRGDRARQRRHEQLALESPSAPDSDVWPTLEAALATLPDAEREAVIMHHLQDRSYAEMATAMGLTEAAARKRVSRGLKSLGEKLRQRGFGGSATALLAGAAALQVGTPSLAVAGTLTAATSFSLTLTTLMAHTTVKIAAGILLVAGIPIAWQSQANSALREEITALQQQTLSIGADRSVVPTKIAVNPQQEVNHPRATIPAPIGSAINRETETLQARLTAATQAQTEAQARLVSTKETLQQLEVEIVISHGNVEAIARSFIRKLIPMVDALRAIEKLSEDEKAPQEAELTVQSEALMKDLRPLVKAMMKLEEIPAEAARVNTLIYAEVLQLPTAESERIEKALLVDFEQLKRDGLIATLRPKENADAWIARREEAGKEMDRHIRALLPPEALSNPLFEDDEGILMGLSKDELDFLADEHKATPQPATKTTNQP